MTANTATLLSVLPTDRLASATANLRALSADLDGAFVERRDVIRALLLALLAREHVALLGDPGTGKSAITNALCGALGGTFFQTLMTKFSVPEEVFGPISLVGLEQDQYRRVTTGYLPTASVAFLDEVFKANSAILNALLTIQNERAFDNGGVRSKVPLELMIGASNEMPQDESLAAMWDRFLLRCWVEPVRSRAGKMRLLRMRGEPRIATTLSRDDLAVLRDAVDAVSVPVAVDEALLDLLDALAKEHGIVVSDRRLRKCEKLVRAAAVLEGRLVAQTSDLMALADVLWRTPEERAKVVGTLARCVAPDLAEGLKTLDSAVEAFGMIDLGSSPVADVKDGSGRVVQRGLASVNDELRKMVATISKLDQGAVGEVTARIRAMQQEVARAAQTRLGI